MTAKSLVLAALERASGRLEDRRARLAAALEKAVARDSAAAARESERRRELDRLGEELVAVGTRIEAERARRAALSASLAEVGGKVREREGNLASLKAQLRKAEGEHSMTNEQLKEVTEQHRKVSRLLDEYLARLARSKDTLS